MFIINHYYYDINLNIIMYYIDYNNAYWFRSCDDNSLIGYSEEEAQNLIEY